MYEFRNIDLGLKENMTIIELMCNHRTSNRDMTIELKIHSNLEQQDKKTKERIIEELDALEKINIISWII